MTREQIGELRRLDREAAPPPWRVRPVLDDQRDAALAAAARNSLRHLLDEREALLDALQNLLYTVVLREEDAPVTGPAMTAARAAIAKAKAS